MSDKPNTPETDALLKRLADAEKGRDEALKVANGALEISADCFNRIAHGDEEITSGQAESLLCETRNALRRIEELTKEKQPHE